MQQMAWQTQAAKLKIARKMPISVPPCLVTRPESYCKGVLRAMIVSAAESMRTEFSGGTPILLAD
jgi:hypothetical protein